ncbi:hypothetical protein [Catelliglobosispora koreensis]|jgi:hypothetical protein|nr:hypothetical protein [Catelliglobosispora koreensis]
MRKSRIIHLRRRALLTVPALVAAAVAVIAKPAAANTSEPECLADILGAS